MNIIKRKYIYFAISLITIIPGLISLMFFGLNPSIDFAGGSRLEYQMSNIPSARAQGEGKSQISKTDIEKIIKEQGVAISSVQQGGKDTYIFRTKPIDNTLHQKIQTAIQKKFNNDIKELSFETVGPVIGKETTVKAIQALLVACVLIVLYIAWSFRKVPKPASSWKFGICAIIALLHDVIVVAGVFSLLGHFFHVEVDSLFVTALLTIIGFSVHDTIVVFDRIRENLRRMGGMPFAEVVNESILQTLVRSLRTSITTLLVLFTLLLFGGESTKWFIVALLIGITSGTYSSIFNAAPLLVVWEEWSRGKAK